MMVVRIFLALIVATSPTSVAAQQKFGDWTVELTTAKTGILLYTVNEDGHMLMRTCAIDSGDCLWSFTVSAGCKENDTYTALGNSSSGGLAVEVECTGKIEDNFFSMTFSNYDSAQTLLNASGVLGIAFPLENGRFSVYRFSLDGLKKGDAFQLQLLKDANSKSTKSVIL